MSAKEMLLEQANARLEHHLDLCRSALKLVLGCETYHNERGHAFLAVPARSLNDLGAQIQFVLDATLIGSVSDSSERSERLDSGRSAKDHASNLVYSSELGYVLKAEAPVETVDQLRAAVIELSNRYIPQHRIREALDRLILAAEARGRQ